jgi:hypothetical protein
MTQLSRPFQIALAAAGLVLAVWFVALRGHSSSSESSPPAASTPAASSPGGASKPGTTGSVYHGSAPGVEGLTHDIAKARGAVKASERNAKQLQEKSAQASVSGETGGSASASASAGARKAPAATRARSRQGSGAPAASSHARAVGTQPMQRTVESELKHGKLVAILLWNPAGVVDQRVKDELGLVARGYKGKLAVHSALPKQVGAFGSFTRAIQVYSTPTILIVNRHGQASTVAGLTDAFSLKQAIQEAR